MAEETREVEVRNEVPHDLQGPFSLLRRYRRHVRSLNHLQTVQRNGLGSETGENASELSAVAIMKMATHDRRGDVSNLANYFRFDSSVARRHAEHLERVSWLLDASEKLSTEHYDEAEELLKLALSGGSVDGHPIEMVLTFYGRYLRERIDVERGGIDLEREVEHVDLEQAIIDLKAFVHESEQKQPCTQISHFTGIQTILDSVAAAEMIHFIDFGRKIGSYWILVMESLARREGCRVKQLKITAVCSPKDNVEEVGKLLSSFAESMNLPFVFKILHSETWEFQKNLLEMEAGEAVAVYMEFCLVAASACSKRMNSLLKGLKDLNPRVMIVVDVEADVNAPAFTTRFTEALLHTSAALDGLEAGLGRGNHYRKIAEKIHFHEVICNGVLSRDDIGGFNRCFKIDLWRDSFAKFGIVEAELSQPSVQQASLMLMENPSWSSCKLSINGECMIIEWNGIPTQSVSAWKFSRNEGS